MKIPESAKDNARNFLNEIGDYQNKVFELGKRGKFTFTIPYGEQVLYEGKPVEFHEVFSCLQMLGWGSDQINDRDNYVTVTIL